MSLVRTISGLASIGQTLKRLPEICEAIDLCESPDTRKEMFANAIADLGVSSSSPRAHRASNRFGCDATEVILREMLESERVARQAWVDTSLQPWCDRHGLTLKQGLSVLFDDSPFNPKTRCDDLVSQKNVFAWGGQQNDFASHLIQEINIRDSLDKEAAGHAAFQEIVIHGVQRWDVMEGTEVAGQHEPTYDMRVVVNKGEINVDVTPVGYAQAVESEGDDPRLQLPQLSIMVEINNGAPCVHIHGDCRGQLAQTIFGLPDGRVALRNVDDPAMRELVANVHEKFDAPLDDIAERFAQALAAMPDLELSAATPSGDAP